MGKVSGACLAVVVVVLVFLLVLMAVTLMDHLSQVVHVFGFDHTLFQGFSHNCVSNIRQIPRLDKIY